MSSMRVARQSALVLFAAVVMMGGLAAPASAQVAVTGGFDATNQYSFRGIRQNYSGASLWPYIDFGGSVYKSDGGVKAVTLNAGTWNAFNTNIDNFPTLGGSTSSNKWYESDLYATLGLGFVVERAIGLKGGQGEYPGV